jgi:hypothetical protein
MPCFLQKNVSGNFRFRRDIMTSSKLRFGSTIYIFFFKKKNLGVDIIH